MADFAYIQATWKTLDAQRRGGGVIKGASSRGNSLSRGNSIGRGDSNSRSNSRSNSNSGGLASTSAMLSGDRLPGRRGPSASEIQAAFSIHDSDSEDESPNNAHTMKNASLERSSSGADKDNSSQATNRLAQNRAILNSLMLAAAGIASPTSSATMKANNSQTQSTTTFNNDINEESDHDVSDRMEDDRKDQSSVIETTLQNNGRTHYFLNLIFKKN